MWSEDTESTDSPLICRGCFSADAKLYNIYDNNLSAKYVELIGISLPDNFSQYLCVVCSALLLKFSKFKDTCHRVQKLFDSASQGKCLSLNSLLELSLLHHKPLCTQIDPDSLHTEHVYTDPTDADVQIKLEVFEDGDYCDNDDSKDILDDYVEVPVTDSKDIALIKQDVDDGEFEREGTDSGKEMLVISLDPIVKVKKEKKKKGVKGVSKKAALRVKKEFALKSSSRKGPKTKTAEDIRRMADSQNFDVVFLTREEQFAEVEDRKNRKVQCSRIGYKKCELCGKNVKSDDSINGHYKSFHDPSLGALECDICFCRFKDNRRLNSHLRIHREKYCCRQCDFVAKGEAAVRKHYEWHKGTKFNCQYCGQTFPKLTSCLSHTRLKHAAELPWCEICGESFIGEKGVQTHKKLAHRNIEAPNFVCEECDVHFLNEKALERHVELKKCDLSNCVQCGEVFATLQLLKYHLVQAHGGGAWLSAACGCGVRFHSAQARDTHTSSCGAAFPCVQCGVPSDSAKALAAHQASAHPATDTYKCDECDKVFTSVYYFRDHYTRKHQDGCAATANKPRFVKRPRGGSRRWTVVEGRRVLEKRDKDEPDKNAVCEVCGKSFSSIGLLKYHQRLHSGEGLLQCSYCPKKFNVPVLLENHVRVHTGERPFKCSFCPKAFKTAVNFKRHHLVHSGLRAHICELCQKSFQTSSCVKAHIRSVHMKIPAPPRARKARVKPD